MLLNRGSLSKNEVQKLFLVKMTVAGICEPDVVTNGVSAEDAIVNAKAWFSEEYLPYYKDRWDKSIAREKANGYGYECDCDEDEDDCRCQKRESRYGDYNKPNVIEVMDFYHLRTGIHPDGFYIVPPPAKPKAAKAKRKYTKRS